MVDVLRVTPQLWTSKTTRNYEVYAWLNGDPDNDRGRTTCANKLSFVQEFDFGFSPHIRLSNLKLRRLWNDLRLEAEQRELPQPKEPKSRYELKITWPGLKFEEIPEIINFLAARLGLE